MKNKQNGGTTFTDADNVWGDGTLGNRQTVGVDAQYGTAQTWDYFKNVHGRNGIANDGKGAYNRVHYGRNYSNAFWSDSCFCMTYGDGDGRTFNPFDSLDVAGHEMSHGVTSRTANLTYSGESGGLNEGTSDIFGTMVEFYANNANDTPDYLIGEKLYKSGSRALRSMIQPSVDGSLGRLLVLRCRQPGRALLVGRRESLVSTCWPKARPMALRARPASPATPAWPPARTPSPASDAQRPRRSGTAH